jgi:DNA-directed RNA polymerase subunit RPC12/RpoP
MHVYIPVRMYVYVCMHCVGVGVGVWVWVCVRVWRRLVRTHEAAGIQCVGVYGCVFV